MQSPQKQEKIQSSKNPKTTRLTINTSSTQYKLVLQISRNFKWKIVKSEDENDDSDLIWVDFAVQPERFCKLKPYQKINHFPNMHELARKNCLAKNLSKMKKLFPADYSFYPNTWLYPSEFSKLKLKYQKNDVFIVKPEALSQGKGIFITKSLEGLDEHERLVIQEYIKDPLLINGLKFDLRVYVLVAGCDPLKIFIHKEGLARFATEQYTEPSSWNLTNMCMHLTNYAINKTSEKFIFNSNSEKDNIGHKQSLKAVLGKLQNLGFSKDLIWEDIKGIVVKTLTSVQPALSHIYKACQPDDPYNGMCFEILGFDILLDSSGKSWLLEVNHSPSFNTDSPLDLKVKEAVIVDSLVLLNLNSDRRKEYEERKKRKMILRTFGKSKEKERENKANDYLFAQSKRDTWEREHLGGFESIFPDGKFESFLKASQKIWVESTGGKLPNKERPVTQQGFNLDEKSRTLENRKADLEVFNRLYNTKKVKIEQTRVLPCFQLDETFRELYFKSENKEFEKFAIPSKQVEKSRFKSTPKKRMSYGNPILDEIFKDRFSLKKLKRTMRINETPLKIFSVAADERAKGFKDSILRRLF